MSYKLMYICSRCTSISIVLGKIRQAYKGPFFLMDLHTGGIHLQASLSKNQVMCIHKSKEKAMTFEAVLLAGLFYTGLFYLISKAKPLIRFVHTNHSHLKDTALMMILLRQYQKASVDRDFLEITSMINESLKAFFESSFKFHTLCVFCKQKLGHYQQHREALVIRVFLHRCRFFQSKALFLLRYLIIQGVQRSFWVIAFFFVLFFWCACVLRTL